MTKLHEEQLSDQSRRMWLHVHTPQLRTAKNGKAYVVNANTTDSFWLLHVYGTPYEVRGTVKQSNQRHTLTQHTCTCTQMGFAHGSMMRNEAKMMVNKTMEYMYGQVESALSGLPTWLRDWVAEVSYLCSTPKAHG